MGFRLGSRRREEKKAENVKLRKNSKKEKDTEGLSARPPPAPGSAMKSIENRSSLGSSVGVSSTSTTHHTNSQAPGGRNVLFRDNRFPDGTTMPRIQTQYSQIFPPGADRDGRLSPTGSVYSSASLQLNYPSYASYPASYVPQIHPKAVDNAMQGRRGRFHSDSAYQSIYDFPFPKPDYPLSNDSTGNSNLDSGLDTESRSSSCGKPIYASGHDKYSQWRVSPSFEVFLSFGES